MHVPSLISAEESEEIGVEHLLRSTTSSLLSSTNDSLSTRVTAQLSALKGLHSRLIDIRDYLGLVLQGKMNVNHQILYNLQDVFNLLPAGMGEGKEGEQGEGEKSFRVQTNDQMVVVYLSSLIRAVIALHNLSVPACNLARHLSASLTQSFRLRSIRVDNKLINSRAESDPTDEATAAPAAITDGKDKDKKDGAEVKKEDKKP